MSETNKNKRDALLGSIGLLFIIIFILSTNPSSLSLILLLILPAMVAVTSYIATGLFLRVFLGIEGETSKVIRGVVSAGFLLVVLLSSLGQFGLQDGLLALLLISGLVFYLKRLQSTRSDT